MASMNSHRSFKSYSLAFFVSLVCLPGLAIAQVGGPGNGGGGGSGGGPEFDISAFTVVGATYAGYKKLNVQYVLSKNFDRVKGAPSNFWPNVKSKQGGMESDDFNLVGLTAGPHDVDVRLTADQGVFEIEFHWIGPDAAPGEPTAQMRTFTIDENQNVEMGETVWEGPHSTFPITGTYGEPLSCGSVLGANLCSSQVRNVFPRFALSLREKPNGSGCQPCGGAASGQGFDELSYNVSFQPHNFIRDSNFGPGLYSNYDTGGYITEKWGEQTQCFIFDPRSGIWVTFLDDEYGTGVGDGILKDRMGYYKHATLIGGTSLETATAIDVEHHDGLRYRYEMFDFPSSEDGPYKWRDRDLRLSKIIDRNSREIVLAYNRPDSDRFDSVTHWTGDAITYVYPQGAHASQPAGSLAIDGNTFTFQYGSNGMLTDIDGPDGWFWTNVVSLDPIKQTTVFTITDPNNGLRKFHGANDFMVYNGAIISQPTAFLKEVQDDADITTLLISPGQGNSGTGSQTGVLTLDYAGNKKIKYVIGEYAAHYEGTGLETYHCRNDFPWQQVGGPGEIDIERAYMLGAPTGGQDMYGNQYDFEYDADWCLIRKEFDDETDEDYDRNNYKQITRFADRLGNVTAYEYDAAGNLLKRRVGLIEGVGVDIAQPEYAEYVFDYDSNGLMLRAYEAEYSATNPDLHLIEYQYVGMRLHKEIQAADISGGNRAETTYTYGPDGLIDQIESPTSVVGQSRIVQYEHNGFGAIIKKTYHDGSTERWIYDADGANKGRMTKYKDRMGVVTKYDYDSQGRYTQVTVNSEHMANDGTITPVTDPLVQTITTFQYVTGTNLVSSSTTDGKTTDSTFDHRHRVVQSDSYPADTIGGQSGLSRSKTKYVNNRVFYTEDTHERRLYRAYSAINQTELIRTVQVTVPFSNWSIPDSDSVLGLDRNTAPIDGRFLITDAIKDAGGQVTELIDPIGTVTKFDFNSRGFEYWSKNAFGTAVEAKTEKEYDLDGRTVLVRSPRFFDASDAEAANMFSTIEYNGRGQVHKTLKAGALVLNETNYNPDGTPNRQIDANGKAWHNYFHSCCGRMLGRKDPLGHGTLSNTDRNGRVTHTAVVENYLSHTNSHDPVDNLTLGETTTRYDALGRTTYRTQWLVPLGSVDSENPPIAGLNGVAIADGITTRTLYDSDLTDGNGLDGAGVTIIDHKNGGAPYTLSLADCLTKLAEPTTSGGAETTFLPGSAGSAVVQINGEGEIQATISDALGRTVMTAQLASVTGSLITWNCAQYDSTTNIDVNTVSTGMLVVCNIDPEGNVTKTVTDGAGRTFQRIDAEGKISAASYNALGKVVSQRDPNGVGADLVYDVLGRTISQTDTRHNTSSVDYDLEGNVVEATDAKGKTVVSTFDEFNRKTVVKDRLHTTGTPSETRYNYNNAGHLVSIVDAEGGLTGYTYDDLGRKIEEIHPDHVSGSNSGTNDYGVVAYDYDPAGRLLRKTDQAGNSMTLVYDMASRITRRDYRDPANSPNGTIADSDTFTFDNAGRTLTADSGRYNNLVTMTYNTAGRLATESLLIDAQTYTVGRTYDSRGQLASLNYPDGSIVERDYNSRGLLEQVKYKGGVIDTRSYDDGGRLDISTYGNGAITDYEYRDDANGQDNLIAQIATTNSGANKVGTYAYEYDANRNKTSETISGAGFMSDYGFSTSAYDDDDRLTAWTRTDGNKNQSWNRSLVGDWDTFTENGAAKSRTHNAVHEIATVDATAVTTDNRGNITNVPAAIQPTGQSLTMTWDMDGRMQTSDSGGTSFTAKYDALGRRVTWGQTTNPHNYVYAGQQIVAVYLPAAAPTAPGKKWVYGSYVDEPILIDRKIASQSRRYYYHRNQQYSITALTSNAGNVVERYAYDAYGNTQILAPNGTVRAVSGIVKNDFMYTGRFYNPTTQNYYFRARMYSPSLGRFVSKDPLGFVDGMSLYRAYFVPNHVDPSGKCWPCLGGAACGVIATVLEDWVDGKLDRCRTMVRATFNGVLGCVTGMLAKKTVENVSQNLTDILRKRGGKCGKRLAEWLHSKGIKIRHAAGRVFIAGVPMTAVAMDEVITDLVCKGGYQPKETVKECIKKSCYCPFLHCTFHKPYQKCKERCRMKDPKYRCLKKCKRYRWFWDRPAYLRCVEACQAL